MVRDALKIIVTVLYLFLQLIVLYHFPPIFISVTPCSNHYTFEVLQPRG